MRARALTAAVLLLALAGCGHSTARPVVGVSQIVPVGTVSGLYEIEGGPISLGGPANGQVHPISGQVTFERGGRPVKTVSVGPNGEFSVPLPPGSYQVTARTPEVSGPAGSSSGCALLQSVTVTNGRTTDISVYCPVP